MPPALPLIVTPAPLKPLTGSLKTAVKLIGEALVGSAWPAAWLIVTVGGVASKLTLLSVVVEAAWMLPAASCATPAGMGAGTVPAVVMPLTATLQVLRPTVSPYATLFRSLPLIVTPAPLKPLTGSLKTAVKLMGELLVGSA